jgi:hypothetical protein
MSLYVPLSKGTHHLEDTLRPAAIANRTERQFRHRISDLMVV